MALDDFTAAQKANALFDVVVEDMRRLRKLGVLDRLVARQLASCDSIAANIEEGYGRGTPRDYRHFLIIDRGSAQETRGRYHRLRHWLPSATVQARIADCDEIIAILTSTIKSLATR